MDGGRPAGRTQPYGWAMAGWLAATTTTHAASYVVLLPPALARCLVAITTHSLVGAKQETTNKQG
jgi:hypothetical protein